MGKSNRVEIPLSELAPNNQKGNTMDEYEMLIDFVGVRS